MSLTFLVEVDLRLLRLLALIHDQEQQKGVFLVRVPVGSIVSVSHSASRLVVSYTYTDLARTQIGDVPHCVCILTGHCLWHRLTNRNVYVYIRMYTYSLRNKSTPAIYECQDRFLAPNETRAAAQRRATFALN